MRPTSAQLLRTIATTLEERVLPQLEGAAWTASYVRSCLMLLAHLEVRVEIEDGLLMSDNVELEALLTLAGSPDDEPVSSEDLSPLAALQLRNEALQQRLSDTIERLAGERTDHAPFWDQLARYRVTAMEREARLIAPTLTLSPI